MPTYHVDSAEQFDEGVDNIAYEVNGELIVRFSKESDSAAPGCTRKRRGARP